MLQRPPHDPAHYWKIASAALEEEKTERLRNLREIDGMRALNRLTLGTRIAREPSEEESSEMVYIARLFMKAYGSHL
jgi:hypothetical protein